MVAALAKHQEALEIFRSLAELLGNPESRRDVSISLFKVVSLSQLSAAGDLSRGDLDTAIARLDSVRGLAEELEQVEHPVMLDIAARFWELRAQALDGLKQSSGAAKSRDRAKSIRDRIR
jgi:hypothetical protein